MVTRPGAGAAEAADVRAAAARRWARARRCDTLFGHAGLHWVYNVGAFAVAAAGFGMLYVVQFVPIMWRDIAGSIRHTFDLLNNETDTECVSACVYAGVCAC